MNNRKVLNSQLLLTLFLVLATSFEVHALTIVRMEVRLATSVGNVDLELYDEQAPLTVSNFLGYVNRGDFDSSFFHRSMPGFVVQGGGFTYVPKFDPDARFRNSPGQPLEEGDPINHELGVRPINELYVIDADNDGLEDTDEFGDPINRINTGLQTILIDQSTLPVLNEPGISNLRGTLAMAKLKDLPNSASNEWFVNVADNSANLDFQNSGFTVFGRLMGSGIDYFDAVNGQSSHAFGTSINPAFTSLPVINADGTLHPGQGLVLDENLAKLNSASEILHIDLSTTDFGLVTPGNGVQRTITVTNRWSNPVTIGQFEDLDLLAAPYSVIIDTCSGATIQSASACNITIELNASAAGLFSESVDLSFVTPDISNVTIQLSGFSSTGTNPDIAVNQLVDFGAGLPDSDVLTETLLVRNLGVNPLTITSISAPSGVDAASFSMTHDCVSLMLGATCAVTLKFNAIPGGLGDKVAEITINTNDPDAPSVTVNLTAFGGDGNNDNLLDIKQATVTSLQLTDGGYITVEVVNNGYYKLNSVSEIANPSPSDAPKVSFSNGFVSVNVATLTSNFDVLVILPVGSNVNAYYQYGVTPTNNVPHWYEFMFDGVTGAQMYKNATLTAPDGAKIQRDVIMIRYQDGARGDNDLTVNGSVSSVGAAAYKNNSSDVGQMEIWTAIMMFLSICGFRLYSTAKDN